MFSVLITAVHVKYESLYVERNHVIRLRHVLNDIDLYANYLRHIVCFQQNLDTDFDAGGKVSVGLTATTIVSQWTWAATLLQSSSVAAKVTVNSLFNKCNCRKMEQSILASEVGQVRDP